MTAVSRDFWKGKRVFITGHTGFKGVWLSLWLQTLGATVAGYSRSGRAHSKSAAPIVDMQSFHGDICDAAALREAIAATQPEIVLHMAAQPLVRLAMQDPVGTYRANVLGTAALLDVARGCDSLRAVIVVTTDKCYEVQDWDWAYREADRLGGNDPYSSSKACMEMVVSAFRDSYFGGGDKHPAAVATARAGNMIGGGDWAADRLVPDMVRKFAAGQPVLLRNPKARRPWQFVLETLRGYLLLAEQLYRQGAQYSGAWNFGASAADTQPVQWIAEHLAQAWGANAEWSIQTGTLPQESQMLQLDCAKAAAELGWKPVLPLAEALTMTADWYKHFHAGKNPREKYLEQIAAYCKAVEARAQLSESECAR
jgi:CDP-glucose 4,6-dehydratase